MNTLQLKEILPFAPSQIIEHARFPNSLLGNVFDKQIKTIAYQGKNKPLQFLEPAEQKRIIISKRKTQQFN